MNLSQRFNILIIINFLFSFFEVLLISFILRTYDENIFSSLGMRIQIDSSEYLVAKSIIDSAASLIVIFLTIDFAIMLTGYTFKHHRINSFILVLNLTGVFVMLFYIVGSFSVTSLWWIFLVFILPKTTLNVIALAISTCNNIGYRRLFAASVK